MSDLKQTIKSKFIKANEHDSPETADIPGTRSLPRRLSRAINPAYSEKERDASRKDFEQYRDKLVKEITANVAECCNNGDDVNTYLRRVKGSLDKSLVNHQVIVALMWGSYSLYDPSGFNAWSHEVVRIIGDVEKSPAAQKIYKSAPPRVVMPALSGF